jgi:radical SAM protein with 4Fe4S-binding SPASM domain
MELMASRRSLFNAISKTSLDYLRRKEVCSQQPFRLWLEPTNICNIRCEMCPNPLIPEDQKGKMDFRLFRKIIDEVHPFINELYMFHRGESLLHRELPDMIRYAKNRGLMVKLNTNATILSESSSRALLTSGLDLISFSVDGYEKDVFERIRVGAHFYSVVRNIRAFMRLKRDGGYVRPLTQIEIMEFLAYSDTDIKERRKAFFCSFEGLAFDRVILRKPHNVGGNISLTKAQGYKVKNEHYFQCSFPWYSLTVHWNGNVCPCPRDFMGDLVVGNVGTTDIADIWNNDEMVALRKSILDKDFDSQACCTNCDQLYKYKTRFAGLPIGYLLAFFKDSPLAYALKRFSKI